MVLTKLDGSAKGGIVFAIETELGLPVKLVGLGESIGDLVRVRSGRVHRRACQTRLMIPGTTTATADVKQT